MGLVYSLANSDYSTCPSIMVKALVAILGFGSPRNSLGFLHSIHLSGFNVYGLDNNLSEAVFDCVGVGSSVDVP